MIEGKIPVDPLVTVQANDADINENGLFTFSITKGNDDKAFRINTTTGAIFSVKTIDYESERERKLVVTASDWKFSSHVNVTIAIGNVNDNKPIFSRSTYTFSKREDLKTGSEFGTVSATDVDPFGQIFYSIVNAPSSLPFSIESTSGKIRTQSPLDRETTDSYMFTVQASDSGTPVMSSFVNVTLNVFDVNDNRPVFTNSTILFTIKENSPGRRLFYVSATDNDLGNNARLTYNLSSVTSLFSVNNTTGEFSSLTTFNREEVDSYSLHVNAVDSGDPQLTSEHPLSVQITILDENDNDPIWKNSDLRLNVSEALPMGSQIQVSDLMATDADQGSNGEFEYKIIGGNDQNLFEIDHETGRLFYLNQGFYFLVQLSFSGVQ